MIEWIRWIYGDFLNRHQIMLFYCSNFMSLLKKLNKLSINFAPAGFRAKQLNEWESDEICDKKIYQRIPCEIVGSGVQQWNDRCGMKQMFHWSNTFTTTCSSFAAHPNWNKIGGNQIKILIIIIINSMITGKCLDFFSHRILFSLSFVSLKFIYSSNSTLIDHKMSISKNENHFVSRWNGMDCAV